MDSCYSISGRIPGTRYGAFTKVLAELTERTGFDDALQTINHALLYQVTDPDSLKNLYRRLYSDVPELPPLPQQSGVPGVAQMQADLSTYDALLKRGVPRMDDYKEAIASCHNQLRLSVNLVDNAMIQSGKSHQEYLYHLLSEEIRCRKQPR